MATIVGHTFIQDVRGTFVCSCGMLQTRLFGATKSDIGDKGWTHSSYAALDAAGLDEIQAEKDRIWRQVTDVASTPDYKPLPKPDEELWGQRKPDVDRPCDTEADDDWAAAVLVGPVAF